MNILKMNMVCICLSLFFMACTNKSSYNDSIGNLSSKLDSLKQEVTSLKDKQEISSLVYQFSDAVMRADSVLFSKMWDDDATWTIKVPMYSTLSGKSAIMKEFIPRMKSLDYFINYPTNYTIKINGDEASALFYILEAGQFKDGKKGYYNYAVYSDNLIKKNGKWLFKKREYNFIYLDHSPMKGESIASPFQIGRK